MAIAQPERGGLLPERTAPPRGSLATTACMETLQVGYLHAVAADRFEGAQDANVDDEHDPEGQTIAWDREQATALAAAARATLAEVDAALARIDAGWDGACAVCGTLIPPERLAARPTADRCVRCAAR